MAGRVFLSVNIRRACSALLMLLFSQGAFGQLNESDTLRVQVRAGINGIRQTGNVDLGILRTRLELVLGLPAGLVFKSQNNTLYQEFGGWKADDDINSRNYLYHRPDRRLYPFAMAYLQSNFRLKIRQRFFAGAGMTLQVLRRPGHSLKTSASLVHESTAYTADQFNRAYYSGSGSIALWRPTLYVAGSHALGGGALRLSYSGYWQPGLDEVSNQRLQAEAGLAGNVWKGLSLTVQYLFFFEEVVPLAVLREDALLTFGLSYAFSR